MSYGLQQGTVRTDSLLKEAYLLERRSSGTVLVWLIKTKQGTWESMGGERSSLDSDLEKGSTQIWGGRGTSRRGCSRGHGHQYCSVPFWVIRVPLGCLAWSALRQENRLRQLRSRVETGKAGGWVWRLCHCPGIGRMLPRGKGSGQGKGLRITTCSLIPTLTTQYLLKLPPFEFWNSKYFIILPIFSQRLLLY